MVFERSGLAIAKEKREKKRETKNKGKERIDDMMMMREFFGILGLDFHFVLFLCLPFEPLERGTREEKRREI